MLEFKKFTDFPRGTMYDMLQDAYSYDAGIGKSGRITGKSQMISFMIILRSRKNMGWSPACMENP